MTLVVAKDGSARAVYGEAIDLASLGSLRIRRASAVEPDEAGRWAADLQPCGGPVLGPFLLRSLAITAEVAWLEANALAASS